MKHIVMLHGYGAAGADLLSLSSVWKSDNRDFIAPNAPELCAGYGPGFEWFSLEGWMPGTPFTRFNDRIEKAAIKAKAWIKDDLAKRGLEWKDLVLMGFSQGSIMAFAVGLSEAEPCAGIMSYSGAYMMPFPPVSTPPVLLVHGGADMVVSPDAYRESKKMLEAFGVTVTDEFVPHGGHWIDPVGIDAGKQFLNKIA